MKYQNYNKQNKEKDKKLITFFDEIEFLKKENDIKKLYALYKKMNKESIEDWLLKYQFLEATNCNRKIKWINEIYLELKILSKNKSDIGRTVKRGLKLFQ